MSLASGGETCALDTSGAVSQTTTTAAATLYSPDSYAQQLLEEEEYSVAAPPAANAAANGVTAPSSAAGKKGVTDEADRPAVKEGTPSKRRAAAAPSHRIEKARLLSVLTTMIEKLTVLKVWW